ncbi:hypothetical protein AC623_11775 [Bacillus sp. FJAT-27231]|uniref:hypothetical protein n=1 Tax=Bacillus sp. FJAT-27231 TaxID=1679168 RepID=UPI0006708214|nr:hypothetical protein [Bacillus sp. FJAT-27231]KMY54509.1 hypothetical protein AC623_11775 [Bacillus sp. FJAT-27231]
MDFPTVYTNFWDAVIAVPIVMALTQVIKVYFHIPKTFVPLVALLTGLLISIFISHRGHITAGIFMGWFYGYAAIGSYAALKTNVLAYLKKVRRE